MRKIISQMMVSLDGYIEGPNGESDWHVVDEEYHAYAVEFLRQADTVLFGRVTYQTMSAFWPTPFARETYPVIADLMNTLPKIVFSRTLEEVEWNNARLITENVSKEILKLKQQPGQDMVILGSSGFAASLAEDGFMDEYHIIVNPVLLGCGKRLFYGIREKQNLRLIQTRPFRSGNVLLRYQPGE